MTLGNAYVTRMPAGFPGMVNRVSEASLQQEILDTTHPPLLYGEFVKIVDGKIHILESGDVAATVICGLIAKPYPVQETTAAGSALGAAAVPNSALPCDILKRGYMMVSFGGTTAAKRGQVYVRVTVGDSGNAVGSIEEGADAGECEAVTNCFFMGAADTNGIVEISYNIER